MVIGFCQVLSYWGIYLQVFRQKVFRHNLLGHNFITGYSDKKLGRKVFGQKIISAKSLFRHFGSRTLLGRKGYWGKDIPAFRHPPATEKV
jgi:hypothetical protein